MASPLLLPVCRDSCVHLGQLRLPAPPRAPFLADPLCGPWRGLAGLPGAAFRLLFDTPCSFSKRATFFGETEGLAPDAADLQRRECRVRRQRRVAPPWRIPPFIDAISAALRVNHSDAARRAALHSFRCFFLSLCSAVDGDNERRRGDRSLEEASEKSWNCGGTPGRARTKPTTRRAPRVASPPSPGTGFAHGLSKERRSSVFSRQIILPSFGVRSQSKLHNVSVLVVGAGGAWVAGAALPRRGGVWVALVSSTGMLSSSAIFIGRWSTGNVP